eukprot:2309477-Karenia_brevis.AAC.1
MASNTRDQASTFVRGPNLVTGQDWQRSITTDEGSGSGRRRFGSRTPPHQRDPAGDGLEGVLSQLSFDEAMPGGNPHSGNG